MLAAALALGTALFLWKLPSPPPVEVVLSQPTIAPGQVYVSGEVTSPGLYPWPPGMTLDEAIAGAGGPTAEAESGAAKLTVPHKEGAGSTPQKVNVNTAEPWLLQALDGIGPKLSEAIVAYREEHGPFRRAEDLARVPGIGPPTVERLKDFITVGE
ncbi:MAG: helix-hairpin-helix domain-containing protein [Dehalococcoidia bacterium]